MFYSVSNIIIFLSVFLDFMVGRREGGGGEEERRGGGGGEEERRGLHFTKYLLTMPMAGVYSNFRCLDKCISQQNGSKLYTFRRLSVCLC